MSKVTERFFFNIIRWGIFLILFLPLFVYKGVMYPYIFSKMIVFQILVEIIFIFWLFLAINDKNYRPNFKNPLVLTLTIFLGILILTALNGADFYRSFWSTSERMTGVLAIFHFYLWFLISTSTLKKWKEWRKLIWASLICSFLVGLYGLCQKLGLKFLLKADDIWRLSSTLGNPIYLGVYSMLHIFLAGFIFFHDKVKKWRGLAILFLTINFLIMLLTASRGVILSFVLSFFFFLIFLNLFLFSKKIKIFFVPFFILFFLIFISGIIFFPIKQKSSWINKTPIFIQRLMNFNFQDRILAWQIGWQGFLEKPFFGWGWENFNIIFNKYFEPKVYRWGEENTWFDKSHNQLIDILALTGIFGLVSYLSIWLVLFWLLLKKYQKAISKTIDHNLLKESVVPLVILGLMFFAYFVQNLTVFDTPAPLIIFYFSLGLVYFSTSDDSTLQISDKKEKLKNENRVPWPTFLLLAIIFLPLIIYEFNLKPFLASQKAIQAFKLSRINLKAGLEIYKKSLSFGTFINPEVRILLTESFIKNQMVVQDEKTRQEITKFILSELEKSVHEHPKDARYWLNLGQFYTFISRTEEEYLDKAEEAFLEAKRLSPKRQQVYFGLINTKLLKNDLESALNLAEEVVKLDPVVGDSHKALGIVYLRRGDFQKAINELEEAEKIIDLYNDSRLILSWSTAYYRMGNLKQAIKIVERVKERDPNNIQIYTHLATLYKEAGEKEKAIETIERILELDPSLKDEVEFFLKSLNKK